MVDEVGDVALAGGVDRVGAVGVVEVEVEQVGAALGVVVDAAPLGLLVGDDLADVLDDEGVAPDRLQRLDAPAATVGRPEDAQLQLRSNSLSFGATLPNLLKLQNDPLQRVPVFTSSVEAHRRSSEKSEKSTLVPWSRAGRRGWDTLGCTDSGCCTRRRACRRPL